MSGRIWMLCHGEVDGNRSPSNRHQTGGGMGRYEVGFRCFNASSAISLCPSLLQPEQLKLLINIAYVPMTPIALALTKVLSNNIVIVLIFSIRIFRFGTSIRMTIVEIITCCSSYKALHITSTLNVSTSSCSTGAFPTLALPHSTFNVRHCCPTSLALTYRTRD